MSAALNDITTSTSAAVGYFVDQKKGEVNELKTVSPRPSAPLPPDPDP